MKTKVYLNDWFFNCGIVGFLKILEHNDDEFAIKKGNYIEFDTENLRNFHKYYFKYFFNKYDVAISVEDRTKSAFEYIKNNIETVLEDKELEKQRKDKIKSNKKYIKDTIKKQLDKIKKIDEQIYNDMKEQLDKIDEEETKEGIENIKNIILTKIKEKKINKRLTLNLFKSILSNSYYGQMGFLNVTKSALSYEEQEDLMYKDYISNIVETGFIHDFIDGKYNIEEMKKYIEKIKAEGNITSEIEKVYSKIEKDYIKKDKDIEEIQKYLKEKVIKRCSMCETELGLTTDYSEGNFIPLAISSDKARNFFWNQNVNFPICDMCRLILFCISAGTTTIIKTVKENGDYKEKQLLSFVNFDTSVNQLYKTNQNFSNDSKYENKLENPYAKMILNIVKQDEKISRWQLDNIFVVEFEAEYGAYSRIEYFNIKRYVAEFFTQHAEKTLLRIMDYKYKLQIVDYILKNKDIKYIINDRLREELKKDKPNGYNSFLATQSRMYLNLLKKEEINMSQIKEYDKYLNKIYNSGVEIHKILIDKKQENKIDSYIYKILNSIKAKDKSEFMYIIIRMYVSMGKDVPSVFTDAIRKSGLEFEDIGHMFSSGLTSNYFIKEGGNENE